MKPHPPGYGPHRFGDTTVVVSSHGTETLLPDGRVLAAHPQTDGAYLLKAVELGYHGDTAAMCREHDYLHAKLCHALGLPCSPALAAAVRGMPVDDLTGAEEDLILAAQRFLNLYRNWEKKS